MILIFLRWYVSRSEDAFKSFVIIAHWLAALVVVSYVCGLVTKFTNQHSAEKDSTLTRNSLSMHLSKKIVFWRGWYCKTGLEVMTKMRKLVTEIWIYNRNVFPASRILKQKCVLTIIMAFWAEVMIEERKLWTEMWIYNLRSCINPTWHLAIDHENENILKN